MNINFYSIYIGKMQMTSKMLILLVFRNCEYNFLFVYIGKMLIKSHLLILLVFSLCSEKIKMSFLKTPMKNEMKNAIIIIKNFQKSIKSGDDFEISIFTGVF